MFTKNVVKRLAILILSGTLLVASGCQTIRSSWLQGDFGERDSTHPRHATGIDSHVAN